MNEYTPTTDEVRERWMGFDGGPDPDDAAEFDRWLADVRAKAWDEGEQHESRFLSTHGQFCPYEHCNPYREGK